MWNARCIEMVALAVVLMIGAATWLACQDDARLLVQRVFSTTPAAVRHLEKVDTDDLDDMDREFGVPGGKKTWNGLRFNVQFVAQDGLLNADGIRRVDVADATGKIVQTIEVASHEALLPAVMAVRVSSQFAVLFVPVEGGKRYVTQAVFLWDGTDQRFKPLPLSLARAPTRRHTHTPSGKRIAWRRDTRSIYDGLEMVDTRLDGVTYQTALVRNPQVEGAGLIFSNFAFGCCVQSQSSFWVDARVGLLKPRIAVTYDYTALAQGGNPAMRFTEYREHQEGEFSVHRYVGRLGNEGWPLNARELANALAHAKDQE